MPVVRMPFAARTDRDHCPTSTFSITIYFDSNETRSYVNSPLLSTRQEYYISLMCTGFWCGSGAALGHQIEKSNFAGETNCIFRGIWEAWEHERNWRALATCNNNIVQKKIWRSPWHRYWHSTRWMFYGGIIEARDTRNKSKHRAEMQCTLHALSASRVSRPPPSSCCGWLTRNHLFVSRAAMLLSGQHHFEFTAF